MSESTVKYPASLVPVGQFAGKPAMPLTRSMIVIGSSKHSRILLKSDTVSSVHTFLVYSNGRWYFRDLVSRTHTILNGKSVREADLKSGDTITIGTFVFHFVASEPAEPVLKVAPAALDITDAEIPVPIDTKTVLIGKRPGCEIRLMEEGVSTAHAIIFECNGVHFIRDLYSRGGTFLNGKKIHQEALKFGDVVLVGETTIKYIPDRSAEVEVPSLLDESSRPVVLHDDPMASHDVPLVAKDLPPVAPHVPMVPAEPVRPAVAKEITPAVAKEAAPKTAKDLAAEAPLPTPTAPAVDPRKPAEIRAGLPAGLSSLLDTVPPAVADATKPASEFESRKDLFEALPIDEADDLVVPLRRREQPTEEVEPLVEEAELSPIAPEVDEVRPADAEGATPVADDAIPLTDDAVEEDDAIPVADEEDAIPLADETPAVANQPLEAITRSETHAEREVVEAEPVDVEVEPIAVEPQVVAKQPEPVAPIDVVDEVELSDEPKVAAEARSPLEDVKSTVVTVPPLPVADTDEVVDVETEAVITSTDAVVTQDEIVVDDVVAVDDALVVDDVIVEDEASTPTAPAMAVPVEQAAAPTPAAPATADAAESKEEPALPVVDVRAIAEEVRREFEEQLQRAASAKQSTPELEEVELVQASELETESEAVVIDEPSAVDESPQSQEVIARADDPLTTPTVPAPLETMEQSPELQQLAQLQARIAQALEDPSSVTREPILPPGAPLVTDPTTAMSAAARRARLIAEMLEETEPIEEEAEREAQSIPFEVDEAAVTPKVEPIPEVEPPPIVAEVPAVAPETPVEEAPSDKIEEEVVEAPDAVEESLLPIAEATAPVADTEEAELTADASDSLSADFARGELDAGAPQADLVESQKATDYPSADSLALDDADVEVPNFALPNAIELSELPVFDTPVDAELKTETPAIVNEVELPSADALDAPLDIEELEPTVAGSAQDEPTVRTQDVFDAASISPKSETVTDTPVEAVSVASEIEAVDGVLRDADEVREDAATVVADPLSLAPKLDASEPISESADDVLVDEPALEAEPAVDLQPIAEAQPVTDVQAVTDSQLAIDEAQPAFDVVQPADDEESEVDLPVVAHLEPLAEVEGPEEDTVEVGEPISTLDDLEPVDVVEVDPEAIEDEIFAQPLEKPELVVETPDSPADLVVQPDEMPVEINDPIAPVEADEYNAGEVMATAVDTGPESAPKDEVDQAQEAPPVVELPALAEVPVVGIPPVIAEDPSIPGEVLSDRVIVEAEEEEPLETQSRPLIAAEEHLVEDEIEELSPIGEVSKPKVDEVVAADDLEPLEAEIVSPGAQATPDATPTIEVDLAAAQLGTAFDAGSNPFAQEPTPQAEVPTKPLTPLEPLVAEGTVEAAKRPVVIETPIAAGATKPVAMNIDVPSMDELQKDFDDAFAEALAMADGKSFAAPAPQAEAPAAQPAENLSDDAKPQAGGEAAPAPAFVPAVKPVMNPAGPARGSKVIDLKMPSVEELEAEFRDAFSEAVAMAEGQSFANKPKFEPRDKLEVTPPAAEASKPADAVPARPQRKLPEFKLDESLLEQAEKLGPAAGSAPTMGAAAFMNLGGIGWIGDETLDDTPIYEQRKPKGKPRRSRQRRPVGDLLNKPETSAEQQAEPTLPTAAEPVALQPIAKVEAPQVEESKGVVPLVAEAVEPSHKLEPADREAIELDALAGDEPKAEASATLELDDLIAKQIENDQQNEVTEAARAEPEPSLLDEPQPVARQDGLAELPAKAEPQPEVTLEDEIDSPLPAKPLPAVIPPRPSRPRKGEAVVDQALTAPGASPFAAQELPLVDAFSGMPAPQLDEVLARLNTSGGAVNDHPPISQDRPVSDGSDVKVPVSPFASQIPIAQPAGNVRRVRQRVSRLPLITGLMLVGVMLSSLLWFIPVPHTVRAELKFKNLERTTELVRKDLQQTILAKLGPEVRQAARRHLDDNEGGFLDLDRDEMYREIVRKAHFDPQNPNTLVIEVPSNVNQARVDEKRVAALIEEFVKANKDLTDDVNKMVDETREIELARAEIVTQLTSVKKRFEELGAQADSGMVINNSLKRLERELASLDESRKQATKELEDREAELKQLEKQMLSAGILYRGSWMRAVPGVLLADASGAVPSTQPADAASELARLRRERDDVQARLDRLTAARSPETAAARASFDQAMEEFSKQVELARSAMGDRPEVLEYIQHATKQQSQIREMTDTLARRQEQQITRLNEFQLRLKEHTQTTRDQRINNDPQMKQWMNDLAMQERRLNVAKESNSSEEDIRDIERYISFLKSNIAAKQELLSDPKEALMVADLEKLIEDTKKDMAADRQRNDAILAESQNIFKSRQPVLEALPAEQRQIAESLTERLARIDLARQRYTDSLAVVAGTDDTLIAEAKKQLQSLDAEIAAADGRAQQEALAQTRLMEKRTALATRVEDARAKVLAARSALEELNKQYQTKIEARDALAAKVTDWKTAAADHELLKKQITDLEKRQSDLIVRRDSLEKRLGFAVVPETSARIQSLSGTASDPRPTFFGIAVLGVLIVGGGFMVAEMRNRIPVPQEADEASDSQTPLSRTPTVA